MIDIIVCGFIYFIISLCEKQPTSHKTDETIIPLLDIYLEDEIDCSNNIDSADYDYEEFDDFGDCEF